MKEKGMLKRKAKRADRQVPSSCTGRCLKRGFTVLEVHDRKNGAQFSFHTKCNYKASISFPTVVSYLQTVPAASSCRIAFAVQRKVLYSMLMVGCFRFRSLPFILLFATVIMKRKTIMLLFYSTFYEYFSAPYHM